MTMAADKQDKVLNFSSEREQSGACSSSAEREKNQGKNFLNVPTLRFPEYSDKWLECELQDIADLSKGAGISKDQLSETGESCILYGELYTKYKSEVISNVISKTDIENSNLVRSKANDVIIPSSGETAIDISTARCVPDDNILIGGDLNIIRLKGQDGRFFSYQLNGVRKLDIAQIAQGVSVVHLYGESLKRLKVRYPSRSEQEKISSLLSVIDERIETQNRIIEDLKQLRSAIRNRIFKKIQQEPEQIVQIKEILTYEQPTKYLVSNTEYVDDSSLIPVLTANKAFILGYTLEKQGVYDKGDCIILDDFTLDCKIVDFPFKIKSSAIKILRAKNRNMLRYAFEYLKYLDLETSEHKRHYITEIEPIEISLPSQEKIENILHLFESLDMRIVNAEKTWSSYLSQKQFLLQTLFI